MKAVGNDSSKRYDWEPLEVDFQSIIAAIGNASRACPPKLRDAFEKVNSAILLAARMILGSHDLPNVEHAAWVARQEWWISMLEDGGGFQRYDASRPFFPFAFKTLMWICLGRRNCEHDRRQTALGFDIDDDRQNPVRDATRNEAAERVRQSLDGLPPEQKEVLICVHWDDLTLAAVARRLGISAATLYTWAFRGREALRKQFKNMDW